MEYAVFMGYSCTRYLKKNKKESNGLGKKKNLKQKTKENKKITKLKVLFKVFKEKGAGGVWQRRRVDLGEGGVNKDVSHAHNFFK